ncbi:spliceosome ATPase-activating subunit SPP2 [Aspergillus saccharolyticus JOP 1030-1]|uniref:Pre-mRNA-splicing factor n=1 Tax=Aspergillus saccharolyticus JOP 1030-1 TaxID=1450539 RepID=A0A319A5W4_9EURO|nr:hypothetical protein BP01DRAFT_389986 [Aspergillus saccharolyticus JOP 1030-1]PYH47448.1 hypothetical protein BP01DRAFT_389986 [Aspergillus saccharolyticus JOP 1030-1]
MSSSNGPQSSGDPSTAKKPFSLSLGKGGGGGSGTTTLNFKSATTKPTDSSSAARSLPLAARGRRPPRQLHDDDEDSEDETSRAPAHEEVTGFDTATGAAISAADAAAKQPLVIPVASNNNWRDRPGARPRGTKNLLPKEVQALQEAQRRGEVAGGAAMETEGPSVVYGLSFAAKNPEEDGKQDQNGDGDRGMEDAGGVVGGGDEKKDISEEQKKTTKPMTQDEVALQALIRESKGETAERGRSDLVIQATAPASDEPPLRYDETSSFRADIASRPESATLDQYNAIPVEEFGAALLRGMGWKEGQAVGKGKYGGAAAAAAQGNKARVPERRPGFLGIGAKDVSGGKGAEAELGAWGKAAMRKGSRKAGQEGGANTEGVYMPVMMRNTKTGEFITEEELSSLKKEAKKKDEDDDWKARRDRNLERSGRDRDDRLRESDRDSRRRDYDGRSSNGSSRRDRSLTVAMIAITESETEIVTLVEIERGIETTGTGTVTETKTETEIATGTESAKETVAGVTDLETMIATVRGTPRILPAGTVIVIAIETAIVTATRIGDEDMTAGSVT